MYYTVIIDPEGDNEEFEDYESEDEASARLKELGEQDIYAVMGWTF